MSLRVRNKFSATLKRVRNVPSKNIIQQFVVKRKIYRNLPSDNSEIGGKKIKEIFSYFQLLTLLHYKSPSIVVKKNSLHPLNELIRRTTGSKIFRQRIERGNLSRNKKLSARIYCDVPSDNSTSKRKKIARSKYRSKYLPAGYLNKRVATNYHQRGAADLCRAHRFHGVPRVIYAPVVSRSTRPVHDERVVRWNRSVSRKAC